MNGHGLRRLRRAAALTQIGLARQAGVSHSRLVAAELGNLELNQGEVGKVRKAITRTARRNIARVEHAIGTLEEKPTR